MRRSLQSKKYTYVVKTKDGDVTLHADKPFSPEMKALYQKQYGGESVSDFSGVDMPEKTAPKSKGMLSDIVDVAKDLWNESSIRRKAISTMEHLPMPVAPAQFGQRRTEEEVQGNKDFNELYSDKKSPVTRNIARMFGRGLSFGASRFLENENGELGDEFAKNHRAPAAIADLAGSALPLIFGGAGMKAGMSALRIPATNLRPISKAILGGAAYAGERQAVDSIGQDSESPVRDTAVASVLGGLTGGGIHSLGRFLGFMGNRMNPVAAKENAGIWGAKGKATNAEWTGQLLPDVVDSTINKGQRLIENQNPNAVKMLYDVGQNAGSRRNFLRNIEKEVQTPVTDRAQKVVQDTVAFVPKGREMTLPLTALGATKHTLKRGTKQFQRITKGAFTDKDLAKLLLLSPDKLAQIVKQRMSLGKIDASTAILTKLLTTYSRSGGED